MEFDKSTYEKPANISRPVMMHLIENDKASPIQTQLNYDPRDPYAVTVVFPPAKDRPVEWTFGRELLYDGLYEPSGDGDVHIWPERNDAGDNVLFVELFSPEGEALLKIDYDEAASFVDDMHTTVVPGDEPEYINVDFLLANIFEQESSFPGEYPGPEIEE